MRELEVLDGGHLKLCWEERKAFFEEELSEQVRGEVKRLLEEALEAERTDWLGVGRYVRDEAGRRDYRNGYYRRDLGTRLGLVRGLRVPRTRSGCPSQLLSRYQRRQESVNELVREAFLRGISTRQVGEVLEPILGEAYSAQTVSRIACGLDLAVQTFHRRRLRDDYVYLLSLLRWRGLEGPRGARPSAATVGVGGLWHPAGWAAGDHRLPAGGRGERSGVDGLLAGRLSARLRRPSPAADRHRRLDRLGGGAGLGLPAGPSAALLGAQAAQYRRQGAEEGGLVRARSRRDLPGGGSSRSLGGVPRLGPEVATYAPTRRGQPGARLGRTAQLLRRPAGPLAQGAHHQCDRTLFPRSPTPNSADLQLHQLGELRSHHLRRH